MACCVAAAWLVTQVLRPFRALLGLERLGAAGGVLTTAHWDPVAEPADERPDVPGPVRSASPTARWVVLGVVVEAAVVVLLIGWLDGPPNDGAAPAGHPHSTGRRAAELSMTATGLVMLAGVMVIAAGLALTRISVARLVVGVLAATIAISPFVRVVAAESHLLLMIHLELLLMAVPAALLAGTPERSVLNPVRASFAAAGVAVVLVAVHLSAVHEQSTSIGAAPWWISATALTAGWVWWSAARDSVGASKGATAILAAPIEIGALLGLLMLSAPHVFGAAMATAMPPAVVDVRLAGAVMMTACLAATATLRPFTVPIGTRSINQPRRRVEWVLRSRSMG